MTNTRLIARLDIKGSNLIKGIHLEGLRVIGDPYDYARQYFKDGIDELLYIDTVASLYGRNSLKNVIEHTAQDIFIPLTVGGGIRSVADATDILRSGADKVAINTAAVARPELITEVAKRFGSQCMVLSVQAKKRGNNEWEAYVNNGREPTGKNVIDWVKKAVSYGAGEIMLTSIDQEGTRKGFDTDLINAVSSVITVPLIASGGMGTTKHLIEAVQSGADAVAMADILHYNRLSLKEIRMNAIEAGITVRRI